jgi:hypothetical protein
MNCAELEILLCDYMDGTLGNEQRSTVESHLSACPACKELWQDASAAVEFVSRAAEVEPPPELVTRIIFHNRPEKATAPERKGWRKWFGGWLEPVLQPRFAMGMAMTILSFSMIGRYAGIPARQLHASDLEPAKVWAAMDDRAHRTWERAVKYYESLRLVYEIQTRLREWTEQEESAKNTQSSNGRMLEPKAKTPVPSPAQTGGAGGESTGGKSSVGNGERESGRESK